MRDIEWFRERSIEDGDCLIWNRACSGNGTPKVHIGDKQYGVRRFIAEMLGMNIVGKIVTNKCGNPLCICPDHIKVVTKKQMADLIVERTGFPYKLERRKKISDKARTRGKLNVEQVAEIRNSDETHKQVAARYGIAKATAGNIRRHEAWRDYSNPWGALIG